MKIVVTDACIFIDVIELQLTGRFFGLNLDIHTTADVLNELYTDQQHLLLKIDPLFLLQKNWEMQLY